MTTNQFRDGKEPKRSNDMETITGRPVIKQKLNPPLFQDDLQTSYNPHIAFSQTVTKCGKGRLTF